MKTFLYIVATIAALFILLMIIAVNTGPSISATPKTQYQACKQAAEHMRSNRETEDVMRNMCDRLPVENADMR